MSNLRSSASSRPAKALFKRPSKRAVRSDFTGCSLIKWLVSEIPPPGEANDIVPLLTLPAIRIYNDRRATLPWSLEDVASRIDVVSNDGRGNVQDYMLSGLKQSTDIDEAVEGAGRKESGAGSSQLAGQFFLDTRVGVA